MPIAHRRVDAPPSLRNAPGALTGPAAARRGPAQERSTRSHESLFDYSHLFKGVTYNTCCPMKGCLEQRAWHIGIAQCCHVSKLPSCRVAKPRPREWSVADTRRRPVPHDHPMRVGVKRSERRIESGGLDALSVSWPAGHSRPSASRGLAANWIHRASSRPPAGWRAAQPDALTQAARRLARA